MGLLHRMRSQNNHDIRLDAVTYMTSACTPESASPGTMSAEAFGVLKVKDSSTRSQQRRGHATPAISVDSCNCYIRDPSEHARERVSSSFQGTLSAAELELLD